MSVGDEIDVTVTFSINQWADICAALIRTGQTSDIRLVSKIHAAVVNR